MKKTKTVDDNKVIFSNGTIGNSRLYSKGNRELKDYIASASISRDSEYEIRVDDLYARSFVINGYPNSTYIGWLDNLYSYGGDMDITQYIEPTEDRVALTELTAKITQYETQYSIEMEKGNIRNKTMLENKIAELTRQRAALEQSCENLFHTEILGTLYSDDKKELNKEFQILENRLAGRKTKIMPLHLRHDDGYKSVLPYGKNYIDDFYRNINTGALSGCMPFYNSEICHDDGVFIGINMTTGTPVFIDAYNKNVFDNANIFVFGKAGSGKTFFVSLLSLRSALNGITTVILDPEGEYSKVTDAVNGTKVVIGPKSEFRMNPCDIEAEDEVDDDGKPTGRRVVNVKEKVSDLLNLVEVMCNGLLTADARSTLSFIIQEVYADYGINELEESLYNEQQGFFDEKSGKVIHNRVKKKMPQLGDIYNKTIKRAEEKSDETLEKVANALKMFTSGGIYDMFDCQTSQDVDFNNAPIITFDISKLEESVLRPIGMYVALSWTWEKFAKKNPYRKKRIVVDEAWMFLSKSMAGSERTASFLENCARRIRKRNGSLLVASQNFREFANSDQGQAVLYNTTIKMFLKQDPSDIAAVQDTFYLSEGEKQYLLGVKRGEMLMKMNNESSQVFVTAFDFEEKLISRPFLK